MDSETFFLHEDYYTVKNGKVLRIFKDSLQETGDSVFELIAECKCLGEFKEASKPSSTFYEVSAKEIIEKLSLVPLA